MLLFLISCIIVFATSFFATVLFEKKSPLLSCIYFLLFTFANVVFTFEVLSLFTAITKIGVLAFNLLFFVAAFGFWCRRGKPVFEFNLTPFFKRLYVAITRDKYLLVLGLALIFMLLTSLFLIAFSSVVNPDAEAYHVLRSIIWVYEKKISHFAIADVRNLVMPINSEILYSWVFLFVQKEFLFGIFSYCGYLLSVLSLWKILGFIGIGFRRKLWTLLIVSSFAFVVVQLSSTETDIIISGLILASICLFWNGLKFNKNIDFLFSALAYALAVGTKTPAIMMIPAVGIWMVAFSYYYLKKNFYKPVIRFCLYFILMFLLFAAYNYILNFIDFGNIAGSKSFLAIHESNQGIRGAFANFIKYMFMFFDFTGFALGATLGKLSIIVRDNLLISLGLHDIADGFYTLNLDHTNITVVEPLIGLGVLGLFVFVPCLLVACIRPLFTRKRKDLFIFSFAMLFFIGVAVLSYNIVFMVFSIRFFASFCVIASPVLIYSYFKKNNVLKFLMSFFALFYLLFLSTHLWSRPAITILRYLKNGATIADVREIGACSIYNNHIARKKDPLMYSPILNEMCIVRNELKKYDKKNKILYLANTSDELLRVAVLNAQGYNVEFDVIENVENIDFSKYNLLLVSNDTQISTNVLHFEDMQSDYRYYNEGISCRYLGTKKQELRFDSKEYPYLSSCELGEYFYRKNEFQLDRSFVIKKYEDNQEFLVNYKFYENKLNPKIN